MNDLGIPAIEWADRIRRARSRGVARGYRTADFWLSEYEPCEMCGVHVVGVQVAEERRVAEIGWIVQGNRDPDQLIAAVPVHRCGGRR